MKNSICDFVARCRNVICVKNKTDAITFSMHCSGDLWQMLKPKEVREKKLNNNNNQRIQTKIVVKKKIKQYNQQK